MSTPAAAPQPLGFAAAHDAEEVARAELYGLLAGLWLAPPDAALLQQFRVAVTQAPQPGGHLEAPWGDLVAALRADLAALGLGRDGERLETEDHVAFVFEVMRFLIAGDDAAVCNLEQQRRFFRNHVQPWLGALCTATAAHPRAQVWRAVAGFTQAFVDVETQGFDLLET